MTRESKPARPIGQVPALWAGGGSRTTESADRARAQAGRRAAIVRAAREAVKRQAKMARGSR